MTHQEIIRALKEAREKSGLSVRDVAEQTGITYSYITRLEKGANSPSLDLILKLCTCYKLKIKITA